MVNAVEKLLTGHSNFDHKREWDDETGYIYIENNKKYSIYLSKLSNFYAPIRYFMDGGNSITQMLNSPDWFRKLFIEVIELYYEKNRLRLLATGYRRRFEEIIRIQSIKMCSKEFYETFSHITLKVNVKKNKKWLPIIENLLPTFEKHHYSVTLNEDENDMYIKINVS